MKPHTCKNIIRFEGKIIVIKGINAISWKVFIKAHRDSKEDCLSIYIQLTDSIDSVREELEAELRFLPLHRQTSQQLLQMK